jgi:hypothetical protein
MEISRGACRALCCTRIEFLLSDPVRHHSVFVAIMTFLLIDFDISVRRLATRIGMRCVLAAKLMQGKEYVNTVTAQLEYS